LVQIGTRRPPPRAGSRVAPSESEPAQQPPPSPVAAAFELAICCSSSSCFLRSIGPSLAVDYAATISGPDSVCM
jgi:hypothetical protein